MTDTTTLLGLTSAGLLAALGLLHVGWGLGIGGGWATTAVIPEIDGRPTFAPRRQGTLAVAAALFAGFLVVLGHLDVWGGFVPGWIFAWGMWGLAAVFLLRAIGDVRLVGFAKRVRGTRFARWDTRLFSPLCLVLAVAVVAAV